MFVTERSPLCRHDALRTECPVCAPFRDAAQRRRENGIRLKRISFMAQEHQVEAFNTLLDSFITRWGKNKAIDHIISILSRIEARMQDAEQEK